MARLAAILFILSTSVAALFLNAVFAVALGCSFYIVNHIYQTYFATRRLLVTENTPGTPLA